MNSHSVLLRLLCLSLSALVANSHLPYPASLPFYGPQVPFVAASVKSPPVIASVKSPVIAPLPPVRARIGVKTVVRPNPAPIHVPAPNPVIVQQPVPIIEQHELPGVPEPYNFNFDFKDDTGNGQYRRESGDTAGVVRGSYGYTDAYGLYRIVDYVADKDGFRAQIRTNEPGLNEPSPVSGNVPNPADITLAAEDTPAKVKDLIRLAPIKAYDGRIRTPSSNNVDKYVREE